MHYFRALTFVALQLCFTLTTPMLIHLTDAFSEQRTALQSRRELVLLGTKAGTR